MLKCIKPRCRRQGGSDSEVYQTWVNFFSSLKLNLVATDVASRGCKKQRQDKAIFSCRDGFEMHFPKCEPPKSPMNLAKITWEVKQFNIVILLVLSTDSVVLHDVPFESHLFRQNDGFFTCLDDFPCFVHSSLCGFSRIIFNLFLISLIYNSPKNLLLNKGNYFLGLPLDLGIKNIKPSFQPCLFPL